MKWALYSLGFLLCLVMLGCSDDKPTSPSTPTPTTASFVFAQRMANADLKAAGAIGTTEPRVGQILDVRHGRLKIEISQGTVVDGQADDFDWILIYDSFVEMRDSDRVFAPVEVPVGSYDNLRITTDAHYAIWECLFGDDDDTIDVHAETSPIAVFGEDGLFLYVGDSSVLESIAPGERLGGFDVRAGVTTHLTLVSNLNTVDWYDHDGSGDWSEGDTFGNVTVVDGAVTMADFVAEYVE